MMRNVILISCLLGLTACASTSGVAKSGTSEAQSVASGKCGLFGWTTDAARNFVFYADQKTARYDSGAGPVDLIAETNFPAVLYKDQSGNPVELRLGEGEMMEGGRRFPGARIVTQTEEGWARLHPVAIVQTCPVK